MPAEPRDAARQALATWTSGGDLDAGEMEALVGELMAGKVEPLVQAALLGALAAKGETAAEVTGAVRAMRARVVAIPHRLDGVVDTCGTGGDGSGTFNVSTAAALVTAAAGVPVAKHGNRSVSSRCGSADVLAELGVALDVGPERAARCLEEVGIAFLFAPSLHPAMAAVAPVRAALKVRTVFNLLGPLTNPAGARRQLVGVYAEDRVELVARVLAELGAERALVVHGSDGLDEITVTGPTRCAEVDGGEVRALTLDPETLGVAPARAAELAGGSAAENARALLELLDGAPGPRTEITVANAGAALWVAGVAADAAAGVERARAAIASGAARATLDRLVEFTRAAPAAGGSADPGAGGAG